MKALTHIPPQHTNVHYMGRFLMQNSEEYICSFPASAISITTNSRQVSVRIQDYPTEADRPNYIAILVDDALHSIIPLDAQTNHYIIYTSADTNFHTIQLYKRTESLVGTIGFRGFEIDSSATIIATPTTAKSILFIGDSMTCGYGNEATSETESFTAHTENAYMTYAAIAARKLGMEYHLIAFSGKGVYRNWGDTLPLQEPMPHIYTRIIAADAAAQWNYANMQPYSVVINLGTNDFSPPMGADAQTFIKYYSLLLKHVRTDYERAHIVCIVSPMLTPEQRSLQAEWIAASIRNNNIDNAHILTFSLQTKYGFGADWHPNVAQHKEHAQELYDFFKNL